jgi:hypothetical protein
MDDFFNFEGFEPVEDQDHVQNQDLNDDHVQTDDNPGDDLNIVYEDDEFNDDPKPQKDLITQLLEIKGINPEKIQMYDEEDNLTEVNFNDLTDEEKLEILNWQQSQTLPSDEELEDLNYLKKNNMTLKDFAEWQKQVGVQEYLASQQPHSEIDDYSDDEIIAYDFIQRFGDGMTDEEIDAEIERLKGDEAAYKKRVELLRNAYKSEAEAQAKLYEEQEKSRAEANQTAFVNAYNEAIKDIDDIQGITLSDADKQELLQFVLEKDDANRTGFSKAMDDPINVLKMAWFMKHGEESFDAVVDYFKKEIAKREKTKTPRAVTR